MEGKRPLTVDQGAVDTIEVFDQHLPALQKDARMASPDALIECAIRIEVDIGIKLADRVTSPDDCLRCCGQWQSVARADNNQL